MSAARQRFLPLGTEAHVDLLHGRHHERIWIAQKDRSTWRQASYSRDEAVEVAANVSAQTVSAYLGQNGFRDTGTRTVDAVSVLTGVFVDLDNYNHGLKFAGPDDVLDAIGALAPRLPAPTCVISSGRGWYASWIFPTPLAAAELGRWQYVENALVEALRPLGADPVAKDAARVLRIVGSFNPKAGRRVEGFTETGRPVQLAALERALRPLGEDPSTQVPHRKTRAEFLRSGELAAARMADIHRLCELRGPLRDGRKRALYYFGVAGCWFWSDWRQAVDELRAFADRHFEDAGRYDPTRQVATVLERLKQHWAGVRQIWNGQACDRRYRMRTSTLVAGLEISEGEQREMRTLIGSREKRRREVDKRRRSGIESREAWLRKAHAKTSEKALEARRMRAAGLTQVAIAKCLGVTQQRVSALLKGVMLSDAPSLL
jgi:hypothetical protein